MLTPRPLRVAGGVALALTLALAACGGDDSSSSDTTAAPTGDDGGATTTTTAASDGGATEIPDDVCELVSGEEVGAILDETITTQPAPQGGCSYNGESAESLYPQIYLENAADSDITGVGDPITIDGHDGYIYDSGASTGQGVFEGVLVVDQILIRVVANSDDIPGDSPAVKEMLTLVASKL